MYAKFAMLTLVGCVIYIRGHDTSSRRATWPLLLTHQHETKFDMSNLIQMHYFLDTKVIQYVAGIFISQNRYT